MTLIVPPGLHGSMVGCDRTLLVARNRWARECAAAGYSLEAIAAALGVKPRTIRRAIRPRAAPVTPLPVCGADAIRARLIEETRKNPEAALLARMAMMRAGSIKRHAVPISAAPRTQP